MTPRPKYPLIRLCQECGQSVWLTGPTDPLLCMRHREARALTIRLIEENAALRLQLQGAPPVTHRILPDAREEPMSERAQRAAHLEYLASLRRNDTDLRREVLEIQSEQVRDGGAPDGEWDWNAAHADPDWP